MIIESWLIFTAIASVIQFICGMKRVSRLFAMILPICFWCFAIYAWWDLSKVGIDQMMLLAFIIPPIWLESVYELMYWRQCYKKGGKVR